MCELTVFVNELTAVCAVNVTLVLEVHIAQLEDTGHQSEDGHHFLPAEPNHRHRCLKSREKFTTQISVCVTYIFKLA